MLSVPGFVLNNIPEGIFGFLTLSDSLAPILHHALLGESVTVCCVPATTELTSLQRVSPGVLGGVLLDTYTLRYVLVLCFQVCAHCFLDLRA